ncbi:WS/DGAT domain-containing protein [Amycolatopsis pittospori]|uniref:WS/DGAT domain-containing protein n=1 Tax=Amycolatopsis pittospori TaxID=2749434 RepID=UPI0015F0D2C6|nr:WS/DGAT domain-containing protein [Amycolatopsis pittospori]
MSSLRRPLAPHDRLWLKLDDPANLMVITSVLWTADEVAPESLARVVADRLLGRYPVFTQRPVREGGDWFWETDVDFSLDRHLTVGRVPAPGTREELQELVAARRALPFDLDHPLWTIELLQGYGTGSAVLMRSHHAMADGIRLIQVLFGLLDPIEEEDSRPVQVGGTGPQAPERSRAMARAAANVVEMFGGLGDRLDRVAGRAGPLARAAVAWPVLGLTGVAGLAGAAGELVTSTLPIGPAGLLKFLVSQGFTLRNTASGVAKLASPAQTETLWAGEPAEEKTAAWGDSVPLDLITAVARATGTSVNDVCVALVMAAFERYARDRDGVAAPIDLNWLLPVSRSGFDAELPPRLGNDFALVLAGFPLTENGFRERLDGVHRRVKRIRESYEPMLTFGIQWLSGRMPESLSEPLTRFFADKATGVLTNVPGPRRPMALAGVRVDGIVGWAPCSGRQAVTVCVFSYAGSVHFGFGTDRKLLPDPDLLVDALAAAAADAAVLTKA